MALEAFIITLIAMAPPYLIARRHTGLNWTVFAYLSGFFPLGIIAAILVLFSATDSLHMLAEKLVYRAAGQAPATVVAALSGPVGAAAISFVQGLGASNGSYAAAIYRGNLDGGLGLAMDSAVILPLAAIGWGRRKRLKNAKVALEATNKIV